jgi:hypothetical protein
MELTWVNWIMEIDLLLSHRKSVFGIWRQKSKFVAANSSLSHKISRASVGHEALRPNDQPHHLIVLHVTSAGRQVDSMSLLRRALMPRFFRPYSIWRASLFKRPTFGLKCSTPSHVGNGPVLIVSARWRRHRNQDRIASKSRPSPYTTAVQLVIESLLGISLGRT